MTAKLTIKPRSDAKKSECTRLRREGYIPGVIYHKTKEAESISICEEEFTAALRQVVSGRLSTTRFSLTDEKGKARQAIIKDIQYNPVSYRVIHLDFEELHDDIPVKVKVPIVVTGEADSVGIKLGGMVRTVIRSIRVECLPKDIPEFFPVDVKNMNIGSAFRISELSIPQSVRPLMQLNSVALSMVKK